MEAPALTVRLGDTHPISTAYKSVKDALNDLRDLIRDETIGDSELQSATCKKQEDVARVAIDQFAKGAAALMDVYHSEFWTSEALQRTQRAADASLADRD